MDGSTRLVPNHSHWGAFLAEVKNGRFVGGVRLFPRDPDPSPLIETMPAAVHSATAQVPGRSHRDLGCIGTGQCRGVGSYSRQG
jgi:Molybdopterin oxidoreductase N-terminal domain